jgi:hypothetical protein
MHPRVNKLVTLFFLLFLTLVSYGFQDSTQRQAPIVQKRSSIKFATRIHSMGLFSYGGRIACDNPSFDFSMTYQRKRWGYFVFKAMDIYDAHSPNNFMLTTLFTNIKLGKSITITPHAAFFVEQLHGLADLGSDAGLIIVTTWQLNKSVKFEYTSMFSNLLLEPEAKDWTNRFRWLYQHDHIEIIYFNWHNNNLFDHCSHFSTGLNVAYSNIKISEQIRLTTGITGLVMLRTTDRESVPKKNGIVFTMGLSFTQ